MPKYVIRASETVYYWKEVEADSEEQVRDLIFSGDVDFDYGDITDGDYFQIEDIAEEKRYA